MHQCVYWLAGRRDGCSAGFGAYEIRHMRRDQTLDGARRRFQRLGTRVDEKDMRAAGRQQLAAFDPDAASTARHHDCLSLKSVSVHPLYHSSFDGHTGHP